MDDSMRPLEQQAPQGDSGKKWLIGCGIGCLILLILGLLAGVGGVYMFKFGKQQRVLQIRDSILANLPEGAPREEVKAELDSVVALSKSGKLGFLTFGLTENMYRAIYESDRELDEEELEEFRKFLHDVVEGRGDVNLEKYQKYNRP